MASFIEKLDGGDPMFRSRIFLSVLLAASSFLAGNSARCADESKEVEALQRDIEKMRMRLAASKTGTSVTATVDKSVENKFGPNAQVASKSGKVEISGL